MLPAIVIGGWLGAGKTTLLNRLLRAADGRRIAVMVNDFGDVGIDADLIVSRDGAVMNLAGGCVCCAVGSDLVEALVAVAAHRPAFDVVLLETSGVALPGSVARSVRLVAGLEAEGTVVLVDAETVRARADDRYVGDTVRRQLAEADLLVLNKTDLIPETALPALHAWLRAAAPRAAIVDTVDAAIPTELVLGIGAHDAHGGSSSEVPRAFSSRPAATRFESASFALDGDYDLDALAATFADPALGLLRAKGTLRDARGARAILQAVGVRVRTSAAPEDSPAAAPDAPSRLVVIGLRGALDAGAIAARLAAARRVH